MNRIKEFLTQNHDNMLSVTMAAGVILLIVLSQLIMSLLDSEIPDSDAFTAGPFRKIWAVAETDKIVSTDNGNNVRSDENGVGLDMSELNQVWGDSGVSIFGAGNEVVAFQLILEAGNEPIGDLDVELEYLRGPEGFEITNSGSEDPFDYVGKHIELFTLHYIDPVERTPTWYNYGLEEYYAEQVPEIAIPLEANPGKGGAPFTIPANRNQSILVDIYIPKDAPSGTYTGFVEIMQNNAQVALVPVELQVYGFNLPDSTSFPNFFQVFTFAISERMGVEFESEEFYELETKFFQMAHRHRVDLTVNINPQKMRNRYVNFLNGEFYNEEHNYSGPGAGVGHGTYAIGTYDLCKRSTCSYLNSWNGGRSGFWPDTYENWQLVANEWRDLFEDPANGLEDVEYFRYLEDEPYWPPEEEEFAISQLKKHADWLLEPDGSGKRILQTYCTSPIVDELNGYCDFWSSNRHQYDIAKSAAERANGNKAGLYNGASPWYGIGVMSFDNNGVEARVTPWVGWKYGVDQYFMFDSLTGWPEQSRNLFENIENVHVTGNGIHFYPGKDVFFPEENRGLDGPLASVRLKAWRRGQQDYEYFKIAEELGLKADVERIVTEIVPKALSEMNANEQPTWPKNSYAFDAARRELADLIVEEMGSDDPGITNTPVATLTPTPTTQPEVSPTIDTTLPPSPTPDPTTAVICGPLDAVSNGSADGIIDIIDFSAFARIYGKRCLDSFEDYDFYQPCGGKNSNPETDNVLDIIDFNNLARNYYREGC